MMDDLEQVMEKIRKAVRLAARTDSEGERDTAMRLAKRLADANGLAFAAVAADTAERDRAVMEDGGERLSTSGCEVGVICYILWRHFGVIAVFTRDGRRARADVSWIGTQINIAIARHVWHVLLRECRAAWRRAKADAVARRRRIEANLAGDASGRVLEIKKQAFMAGFFAAIDRALEERPIRNDMAAARTAAERRFDEFRAAHAVKTRKKTIGKGADARVVAMGAEAGGRVNLSRPCEAAARRTMAICG